MRICFIALSACFLMFVGGACAANLAQPALQTSTPPAFEAGNAALQGIAAGAQKAWPAEETLSVYAAPYYGSGEGGYYLLEPDLHPGAELQTDGAFLIRNVPPGTYVLVVGPSPEEARLVITEDRRARLVVARGNEISDLGVVQVDK